MQASEKVSLVQIRAFLDSSEGIGFGAANRQERYAWVDQLLREQDYERLSREGKGLVRRYAAKMTGMSRAQLTRLIGM